VLQVRFALGKQRFAADREVRPFGFNRKRVYELPQNSWIGRIIGTSDRPCLGARNGSNRLQVYVTPKCSEMVTVILAKLVRWNVIFRTAARGSLAKSVVISLEFFREHSSPVLLGSIKTVEPSLHSNFWDDRLMLAAALRYRYRRPVSLTTILPLPASALPAHQSRPPIRHRGLRPL
jgi:hypothetical protein